MKKTSIVKIVICLLSLALICIGLSACKEQTYTVTLNYDKTQGTVTVSPTSDDGVYAEGTELTVTVTPVDGYAVESFKLGTEDKTSALNNQGKFTFTVQQDTTVTVTFKSTTVAVESVSLNKQSLSVHVTKQDASLTAHVLPENATDKTVTWTSSVPAVATVDTDGKITAVAAGETVITATAGDGKTATCTVTVTDHQLTTVSAGESGHKSVCGVEGCGYESAVTAHSLTINSDKTKFECEQCDYEVEHTHDIKVESAGVSGHKSVCQTEGCGYESAVTAHSLTINSDKTKFECEQCEYEENHSHDIKVVSAGESGHKDVCQTEGCGYESEVTAHSLKINSAKDKFECEQCEYEENHTHKLETKSAGESGHKSVCQTEGCGYESEVTAHSMKINSAKDKFECEQCEYEVAHTHDIKVESAGANGHKSVCQTEGCGYESAVTAHSLKINSAKDKFQCEQCEYEENHTHKLETKSAGANGHKDVCQTEGCGYESEVTAHSLKINSDKTKFECEQCEYEENHSHAIKVVSVGESGHKDVCQTEGCGYESQVKSHNLDSEAYADGDQGHHFECLDCGYDTETVAHVNASGTWTASDNLNEGHYYVCSVCEQRVTQKHTTYHIFDKPEGMYVACRNCNYYVFISAHQATKPVADESGDSHHYECESEQHIAFHCTYKTESVKCEENGQVVYKLDVEAPESGHTGKCVCGNELALEAHDQLGEDGKCSKCGYKKQEEHVCADNPKNGFYDGLCDVCSKIVDNFWDFDSDKGIIKMYNGKQEKVEIPRVINVDGTDRAVTGIMADQTGSKGFRGNTTITDVIVPQSITTLPNHAFNGCVNLKSAVILATITELPQQCFHNCKQLTTLVLSASITSINKRAFGLNAGASSTVLDTIYYLGSSEQWDAIVQAVTEEPAKTTLSNVKNVYFYNAEKQTGMWHWQSGAENMIPELWGE